EDRAVLDAYVAGVNDGLASLGAWPFEYIILRQRPVPWRAEDSLLVVLSMFVTLQDPDATYESTLATMHDFLPGEMVDFLTPDGPEWDSASDGTTFTMPPIPSANTFDARTRRRGKKTHELPKRPELVMNESSSGLWALGSGSGDHGAFGSNNFAVSARLTRDG